MINMTTNICFHFTLNLCENEWHVLQHEACKILEKEMLHCIPKAMTFHSTRTVGDEDVDFYYRLNEKSLAVELITIPTEYNNNAIEQGVDA